MRDCRQFYINGSWVPPVQANDLMIENPATEKDFAVITEGSVEDLNKAVAAARQAFDRDAQPTREQRITMMTRILEVYSNRISEVADAITKEMGAPTSLSTMAQAALGQAHLSVALESLKTFEFQKTMGNATIVREPIGVCGFITPWNWPINQILCKVAPALAMGCTIVLKPSEIAPVSAYILADILHEAGVPAGVFNMINGTGPVIGDGLSSHPDIDMISFTGSTRAGIQVAKSAADTVKRVAQELGGKSPNIILTDANLQDAVTRGVQHMMINTGQSCNAPSRMLVHESQYEQAVEIARLAAEAVTVGDPAQPGAHIGPLSSKMQFDKVQGLIELGIKEGGRLVAGGLGKPEGYGTGHFVKPTIFADISSEMSLFREEIFGPVLVMTDYKDDADAIRLANDTPYGLAAYVQGEPEHAMNFSTKIRAGMVQINGANHHPTSPFGGYKQSGNGREWGVLGFDDFLETKAISL